MYLSITKVENNRLAKFATFETLEEAESHATEYNGIVYEGEYSPQLWVENGQVSIVPIQESGEQKIARLESAIDRYLDQQAQSLRYESIRTMVTYENDPNPKFNAEGVGAKAFRSAVYTLGVNLIGEVQSGLRAVPTEEELLALMPKLEDFVIY